MPISSKLPEQMEEFIEATAQENDLKPKNTTINDDPPWDSNKATKAIPLNSALILIKDNESIVKTLYREFTKALRKEVADETKAPQIIVKIDINVMVPKEYEKQIYEYHLKLTDYLKSVEQENQEEIQANIKEVIKEEPKND